MNAAKPSHGQHLIYFKKHAFLPAFGYTYLKACRLALLAGLVIFLSLNAAQAQNWTWQNPQPQGSNLNEVCFPNANIGYTVGLDGTILKTTDGGNSWTAQNTGTMNSFSSVYFTDADTGYAVGGSPTILKTTDGGLNWMALSIPMPYSTSVFFYQC